MKHLKMLGIAAACSSILLLAIGAGSASAAICSSSGTGSSCGTGNGNVYQGPFSATVTEFTITDTFINMKCTSGTASGSVTNGEKGTLSLTGVTYSGCKDSYGDTCTVTSKAASNNPEPGTMAVSTSPNGTVTLKNVNIAYNCSPSGFHCSYTAESMPGTVTGGSSPSMQFPKVEVVRQEPSGFGCPASTRFSVYYKITTPSTLFLV